uniref:Uncharacterized protein n=1 Tax=Hyaloperonospora arabidopsidis (strain Emoy2) TaxID=559515 RepID=M4B7W3_HYAAE
MSAGLSSRRKRQVTFDNAYTPEIVPARAVTSYDELVFHVAGLFHTRSFLHDVEEEWNDDDDELTTSRSSSADDGYNGYYDPEPPLERSVPLMIAEFLYRSAMYLGYPPGDTPWLPGFRQDKRFSGNDVKRWRRLAHFDWEAEEREFRLHHPVVVVVEKKTSRNSAKRTLSVESNGHSSVLSTLGASFHGCRRGSCGRSASVESDVMSMGSEDETSQVGKKEKLKFRSTVSGWIRKHRRPFSHEEKEKTTMSLSSSILTTPAANRQENGAESGQDVDESGKKGKSRKRKPVSWLHPPPVSSSRDLRLLVDIINSKEGRETDVKEGRKQQAGKCIKRGEEERLKPVPGIDLMHVKCRISIRFCFSVAVLFS